MSLTVITNHIPRDVIDSAQLSEAERAEFDYLDWPALDDGRDSASFVRYRGQTMDLGEFMFAPDGMFPAEWDGYASDSFFSGTLVRYVDDGEGVIVGRYYS